METKGNQTFNCRKVGQGNLVLRKPTYREGQHFRRTIGTIAGDFNTDSASIEQTVAVSDELETVFIDELTKRFVSWDWKDENGSKLPDFDESVLDIVTMEEGAFLIEVVRTLFGLTGEVADKLKK